MPIQNNMISYKLYNKLTLTSGLSQGGGLGKGDPAYTNYGYTNGVGNLNDSFFKIKKNNPISQLYETGNDNTFQVWVSYPTGEDPLTNSGWDVLQVTHIFSNTVYILYRKDASFTVFTNSVVWVWSSITYAINIRNTTSGQNTYNLEFI
jgi:hypothetical protein